MNAGLRCARQPFGLLLKQHPRAARTYSTAVPSTAAAASTPADGFVPTPETAPPAAAAAAPSAKTSPYNILSGVVLSRPPTLTRPLTEFEESFYFYQRRLNQRLSLPFTRYFYFKKDTPADAEWKRKQKALGPQYTGFGKDAWKDELLVGDNSHKSPDFGYRRLVETTVTGEDGENVAEDEKRFEAPLGRRTKADEENDRRSLDRKGERTLYLLVKNKGEKYAWRFPQAVLTGRETLKEAAVRTLAESAGVNMNTWFVGNVPIGHLVHNYKDLAAAEGKVGEKVFFMKARIMAGQADLRDNKYGLEDFMWLTKEEVGEVVEKKYWEAVRHMLVAH